jgi:isopentenyl diphosphate isomerase/L-lactate dehydrogenase-like FMN-dependent dehydrogenase
VAQRIPPAEDLVNTLEMEAMARRRLAPERFEEVRGGDRAAFDRMTFRPRLMVNSTGLDLSIDLFGQKHFAPILIGPTAEHGRYHAEAERATAAGAAAAKAGMVLAARTSVGAGTIETGAPLWRQVELDKPDWGGATVVVVTLTGGKMDWGAFEQVRAGSKLPVVLKGIVSAREAAIARDRGASGIVLSNWRPGGLAGAVAPIEVLPSIAAELQGKLPILIDGGFRRGSDILKALALGARAVLVGRPVLWGLAAYGARGVQQVMEQLQTELARDMAMCGITRCDEASRQHVRIHSR